VARRAANRTCFNFQGDLCAAARTKGSHAGQTSRLLSLFDEHSNAEDSRQGRSSARLLSTLAECEGEGLDAGIKELDLELSISDSFGCRINRSSGAH
jgi:hypothetical protein